MWSFHRGRRALKDRFSGKAVGNPALGQKDEAGDILRTAVWRSVTPGLFRVEYILLSPWGHVNQCCLFLEAPRCYR